VVPPLPPASGPPSTNCQLTSTALQYQGLRTRDADDVGQDQWKAAVRKATLDRAKGCYDAQPPPTTNTSPYTRTINRTSSSTEAKTTSTASVLPV